ncbi:hypothetical protein [Clostridium sp.]|uniref:hypothetical protein n=1 Tax=Clostridium sp. TaxID=1506 RepID=UPI00261E201D|nr:hypothetical protein [Clostridium sp.]
MELSKAITGTVNLESLLKGLLTVITISMYLTAIKKSKVIKLTIMLFGVISAITLAILILIKSPHHEIRDTLTKSLFFCIVTFFGIKGTEKIKQIDDIIKEQKYFKKIDYNIKIKEFNKKELEKIKDNLYNYFRFFEFNSYDSNIGKLKIDIKRISKTVIEVDVDHTLSDESEIYYYDIVSRYESLKNINFLDEVYLKYDKEFNNKIRLITRIITEEEVLN